MRPQGEAKDRSSRGVEHILRYPDVATSLPCPRSAPSRPRPGSAASPARRPSCTCPPAPSATRSAAWRHTLGRAAARPQHWLGRRRGNRRRAGAAGRCRPGLGVLAGRLRRNPGRTGPAHRLGQPVLLRDVVGAAAGRVLQPAPQRLDQRHRAGRARLRLPGDRPGHRQREAAANAAGRRRPGAGGGVSPSAARNCMPSRPGPCASAACCRRRTRTARRSTGRAGPASSGCRTISHRRSCITAASARWSARRSAAAGWHSAARR